jgi:hypothetical protein
VRWWAPSLGGIEKGANASLNLCKAGIYIFISFLPPRSWQREILYYLLIICFKEGEGRKARKEGTYSTTVELGPTMPGKSRKKEKEKGRL